MISILIMTACLAKNPQECGTVIVREVNHTIDECIMSIPEEIKLFEKEYKQWKIRRARCSTQQEREA